MSDHIKRIISANSKYVREFGDKTDLAPFPEKRLAVLTCMDARLEPLKFLGLELGDAHIIRNAGGRASDDAIRSLVVSNTLLGTNEFLVIHHTECGMERFTQEEMGRMLKEKLDTSEGEFVNWLSISDRIQSVKHDVLHIKNHPLVSDDIKISGHLFNTKTGELSEVIKV